MKRYTSIYKAAFFPLVLALLFASCENLLSPPPGDKALSVQAGKASVSIMVSDARTVLPEVNPVELTYTLIGKTGETVELDTVIAGSGTTLVLAPGDWTFTLNALKGDDIVLTGDAPPVTLKADESAMVEFTLRPLKEGNGAVNISFTNLAGISKVIVESECDDLDELIDPLPAGSATWAYVKADIPAGDYFTTFTFYRGEEAAAVVSEIIQVRNGLTSKKTIGITIDSTKPAGNTLAEKLQWIADNAESDTSYLVEVTSDEAISSQELRYGGYPGKTGISITLIGIDEERTISLSGTGTMFSVGSDVTLTLENNITLKGRPDNTDSLVYIGGNLVLNDGAKISGNNANFGGGVLVDGYSTFTMNGGEISGNTANFGGGVTIEGDFTMKGGKISGNNAGYGGGVYGSGYSTFIMSGGEISGNTATLESGYSDGGGVYVEGTGVFSKTGGVIYGNDGTPLANNAAAGRGRAVYWYTLPLYRDSTLNAGDNISTANTNVGWESIARPEAATLVVDQWISGPITAGGEKWFKFTASDANQYIHSKGGGTWQLMIDVYDSALQPVGGRFLIGRDEDLNNWNYWSVSGINPGQTYYVRIWSPIYPPGYPGYSGNYEIMLTKSPMPKGTVVTPLSEGWNNGSFAAGKDEWFSFIANTAIPYLHFNSDSLNEFNFRVYDSTGQLVNYSSSSWDDRSYTILYGLSPGHTYSLNVSSGPENSGDYKIAVNQSPLPPGIVATELTSGPNNGNITAGGEEWFTFNANANPQTIGILSGGHNEISVELYSSDGQEFSCSRFPMDDTTSIWFVSVGLSLGQSYYIRISSDTYSGDYQIGVSEPDPPSP